MDIQTKTQTYKSKEFIEFQRPRSKASDLKIESGR